MRPILKIAIIFALGAGMVQPAAADFGFTLRIGNVVVTTPQPRMKPLLQPRLKSLSQPRRSNAFWGERRSRPERPRPHPKYLYPIYPYYADDYYGSRREVRDYPASPPPAPTPPVATVPAELPPPPDPHGPLRLTTARGVTPVSTPYNLGESLPPRLPHVTLDWRQYDLPEPPAGRIYARVGRDVLVITADERVVEKVLPPG